MITESKRTGRKPTTGASRKGNTMKKYYRGWTTVKELPKGTEKAIPLTLAKANPLENVIIWIPKSQIIIGEPNQYGNAEILIPLWVLYSNGIRFRFKTKVFQEIEEYQDGSPNIIER